jgi:hypothetical protein
MAAGVPLAPAALALPMAGGVVGATVPVLDGAPAAPDDVLVLAGAAPDALAGVVLVAGGDEALAAGVVVIAGELGGVAVVMPLGAAVVLAIPPSLFPPQPMAATTHNPAQPKRSIM